MKKDLIRFIVVIALMLLFAILCGNKASAQVKSSTHAKPPVEKPTYNPDGSKLITFTVTLRLSQANDYILVESNGGPERVKTSPQITGIQLFGPDGKGGIIGNHQATLDSLNARLIKAFNDFIKADQARFTADTTELNHPLKK
jgi:hypothetical protein